MKVYKVARGVNLLLQTLETRLHRFKNFLGFAKNLFIRKNPLKAFAKDLVEMIKEFLTMNKKLKMSRYRLNYHKHQLEKMETLIAENNEHAFLRGQNLNTVR
jgi:hypothetical protein